MKLVIITNPSFLEDEAEVVTALFDVGLEKLHLRKPGAKLEDIVRFLEEIPERYRSRITIHEFFELKERFGLGGIHLNARHPVAPENYKGGLSCSCHTIEEVAGVMQKLIDNGKILHWGLSEADEEHIRRAHKVCPVTAIQNRYHMMYRNYEALFPTLEELNIGFVPFSPLANGLLSGKYNAESKFNEKGDYRAVMPQFQKEAYEQNRELLALLHNMAEEKNATPAQISLAWMICKKPWIAPIPGTRKPERLIENAGAADISLSAEEVKRIDEALDKMQMSAVYGGAKTSSHNGKQA